MRIFLWAVVLSTALASAAFAQTDGVSGFPSAVADDQDGNWVLAEIQTEDGPVYLDGNDAQSWREDNEGSFSSMNFAPDGRIVTRFANASNIGNATGSGGDPIVITLTVYTSDDFESFEQSIDRDQILSDALLAANPSLIIVDPRSASGAWFSSGAKDKLETTLEKPYDPPKWKISKNGTEMVEVYQKKKIITEKKSGENEDQLDDRHSARVDRYLNKGWEHETS